MQANNIKTILFTMLCICFIFYLFIGIYSYMKNKKSKVNRTFLILCVSASLWAIGYAFMLISPNIEIANLWKIISAPGWCFFDAIWVTFAFSLRDTSQKNSNSKIQHIIYITSIVFCLNNLLNNPSKLISSETYGYVDNLYGSTPIGIVFSVYFAALLLVGFAILCFQLMNSQKNRIKKQIKIISITSIISFCLGGISDLILPAFGINIFPTGIIAISIGLGGMWYAINKHRMMSISYELVSEYIFEAVNEPIIILVEDFLVKNCNKASLNITGYTYNDLKENSLNTIINFRNFNFNSIMQSGNFINIEVDLHRKNKENLVCELSATVIYDEYEDVLGILILLHDVSERKKIAKIQKKYTLKLKESNLKLNNEITDRIFVEEQIRHFVYYDSLTELYNRKKMLEDINILLDNKNEKFAILFIDLDKFKCANDNYGHQSGDYILETIAVRLKSIVSSTDTLYRIGGDEFIIILRNLNVIADAKKIALAALDILSSAFIYKENQLFIGSSIGISIFPEDGIDEDTLIKKADLAMYEAKRNGGNEYKIYSSGIKSEEVFE